MTNQIRDWLLRGAIRKDRGRGTVFFEALADATLADLRMAQSKIEPAPRRFSHGPLRLRYIKERIEFLEQP